MTPPTSKALEEAVERAARWFNVSQTEARGMLSAALPGLFNGTMWLAPWEADASMIGRALPLVNEITAEDKRVGAEACMRLTAGRPMAREGDAVIFAAQLRTDFRAMRDAYLNAERKE